MCSCFIIRQERVQYHGYYYIFYLIVKHGQKGTGIASLKNI